MTDVVRCPTCRRELPADAPGGLCPRCLMQAGLSDGSFPTTEPAATPASASGAGFVPPTPAELAPLVPQLEILELLGRGGMGAVYKARQRGLDRLVAVKILPPAMGRDPSFTERFLREARALARLNHPNIVAVYDFGQTRGQGSGDEGREAVESLFYIVMEFVDGANLRHIIREKATTPVEALALVPQICEALQFAHDEGIVHRDIKPENILVDRRGRVKIADFGLAKLVGGGEAARGGPLGTLTDSHQVMGTVRYMAPEQMEGSHAVDHRADIYSLGVVFYELLTGELPIGRFAPPSKKVRIDVRLDEVVLRALEKEPEQRWQHADDVKTQVDAICTQPVVPQSVTPQTVASRAAAEATSSNPPRPERATRVRRSLLALVAVAAATAGVAPALKLWNPTQTEVRGATYRPQSRAFAELIVDVRMTGPRRTSGRYERPDVCEFTLDVGGYSTRGRYTVDAVGSLRWTVAGEERPFERDRFLTWLKTVAGLPFDKPPVRLEAEELADVLTAWNAEAPGTFEAVFAAAQAKLKHFERGPDVARSPP